MVNLRLKAPSFFRLSLLILALIFPLFAQENGGAALNGYPAGPYKIGEHLTYNVSYSNFPSAAHVEIQVVTRGVFHGRDAIQLHAHVETSEYINVALFAMNNDYTTYVDPESGLPFRGQETVHEGSRTTDNPYEFSQPLDPAATTGKQGSVTGTYDFLSALFRLRALPLTEGTIYRFNVRGGGETYQAEVKIVGHEPIMNNVGSFNALVGQVRVSNNDRINGYRIKIYFSDDERHLPVRLTAKVKTGELRADLAGSEIINPPPGSPSATPTPAAVATPVPTPPRNPATAQGNGDWPFKIGEQLNYQVFLGGSNAPVGTANFEVAGRSRYFEHDGLLLKVKAQTTGAVARLFVANDAISSYVDPKALLPYRTELNLAEGRRRLNRNVTINQDRGSATTNTGEKIDIPVGTHDYLSFFYAFRSFNLNPPKRNAISMLVENKAKTIFVSSLKREVVDLSGQKIPAIALTLTTDDPQSDKYQFRLWVSDDSRRLPLRITCVTELGALRADLVILPATSQ
jgi:hypothetical protein